MDSTDTTHFRIPPVRSAHLKKTITRPSYVTIAHSAHANNAGETRGCWATDDVPKFPLYPMSSDNSASNTLTEHLPDATSNTTLYAITPPDSPAVRIKTVIKDSNSDQLSLPPVCLTPDYHSLASPTEHVSKSPESQDNKELIHQLIAIGQDTSQSELLADDRKSPRPDVIGGTDFGQQMKSQPLTIYLRMCQVLDIPPSQTLSCHLKLTLLNLKYCSINESHAQALSVALIRNQTITCLDISSTNLGDNGFVYLCQTLQYNKAITDLYASDNSLSTVSAQKLSHALRENKTLQTLNLSSNSFKDSDGDYFSQIFRFNSSLTSVQLQKNKFGDKSAVTMGRALTVNNSLEHLNLSWNHIRRSPSAQLVRFLNTNDFLVDLNLSWNGLGLEGCKELGSCLKLNTTIESVDISANRISKEAFREFNKGFLYNNSIRVLKIGSNPIGTDGIKEFLAKVEVNQLAGLNLLSNLVSLELKGIPIENDIRLLAKVVQKRLPSLAIDFGPITYNNKSLKQRVKLEPKRLTVKQARAMLLDETSKAGIDLKYVLGRGPSRVWQFHDFKEFIKSLNLALTEQEIDMAVRKLNKDGEITPSCLFDTDQHRIRVAHNHHH